MVELHPVMAELVAARKRAGLSGAEVARRLDLPRQNVFNWESGRHRPGLEALVDYAAANGVTLVMQVVDDVGETSLVDLSPDEWRRLMRHAVAMRVAEPAHLQVVEMTVETLITAATKASQNGNGS